MGALFVISCLTMDQKHEEEHEVEVGDRSPEASWERPCDSHDEVTPTKSASRQVCTQDFDVLTYS